MTGTPVFSLDGKRCAYGAKETDKWVVVLDGQSGPEHDGIISLSFHPDGVLEYLTTRGGALYRVKQGP
jgi:hypothetical protein